jgi:probable phosphoglycerate mutase
LDEVGEAQAVTLVARLAEEPIDVVMTSDITRAHQTGQPLAQAHGVPLITHPGVREVYAGDWEMSPDWQGYIEVINAWKSDPRISMPNGDDGLSVFARFDQALTEIDDYRCAAVVSHGGVLRTWLSARGGVELGDGPQWHLDNTDIVVVEGDPGSWKILSWAGREV